MVGFVRQQNGIFLVGGSNSVPAALQPFAVLFTPYYCVINTGWGVESGIALKQRFDATDSAVLKVRCAWDGRCACTFHTICVPLPVLAPPYTRAALFDALCLILSSLSLYHSYDWLFTPRFLCTRASRISCALTAFCTPPRQFRRRLNLAFCTYWRCHAASRRSATSTMTSLRIIHLNTFVGTALFTIVCSIALHTLIRQFYRCGASVLSSARYRSRILPHEKSGCSTYNLLFTPNVTRMRILRTAAD